MPPKNDVIYFHKAQIDRVIELYQEEEDLWNVSSSNYFKKDKKNAALDRIKMKMEESFDDLQQFTSNQLWNRLANLRSYYTRELKKVNDSRKSGSGTDDVYVPSWCHFQAMDNFLRGQVVPRKSSTNLDTAAQEMYENDDDDDFASLCSEASGDHETTIQLQTLQRPVAGKKRKVTGPEQLIDNATAILEQYKTKKPEAKEPVKKEDEFDILGKYLAFQMRKIEDPRARGLAILHMQQILFDAQFGASMYATMSTPLPQ